MQESFLHFVWLSGSFPTNDLHTTDNQEITIIKRGHPHLDGGPDFNHARLRIGAQQWAGHVEIHVKSNEWYAHNHHRDAAYDTTILHVCYEFNQEVFRTDGSKIPCLELAPLIAPTLIHRYENLIETTLSIPCANMIQSVPDSIKTIALEQMMGHRMDQRHEELLREVAVLGNDWNSLFYRKLCQSFGLRINQEPFGMLANLLPFSLISLYRDKVDILEALLFGVAGFLQPPGRDIYERELARQYTFLKHKHSLKTMPPHLWKFLRLRPANFPTIRLAQLAQLLHQGDLLFSKLQTIEDIKEGDAILRVEASDYWLQHYRFGEIAPKRVKRLGRTATDLILLNAVIPMLFSYNLRRQDEEGTTRTMHLLEQLPGENNRVTRKYESLGFSVSKATSTQGILHLSKNFCSFKRCLECPVGHHILRQSNETKSS